jgi:hypothetical protein
VCRRSDLVRLLWFSEDGHLDTGAQSETGGVPRGASHGATIPTHSRETPCAWARSLVPACPTPPAMWGALRRGGVAGPGRVKRHNARQCPRTGGCRATRRPEAGDATTRSDVAGPATVSTQPWAAVPAGRTKGGLYGRASGPRARIGALGGAGGPPPWLVCLPATAGPDGRRGGGRPRRRPSPGECRRHARP